MIEWLVDGWPLFGASYVAAWCLAVALPLGGIPVVAREQALLGVGLVQMGACGFATAVALALPVPAAWAFIAIAVATILAQRPPPRERPEAVAAWMILAGGAATVLLLARHPQGAERLARLATSSVLGAEWDSASVAIVAALAVLAIALTAGRRVLLVAWEPRLARLQGARPGLVGLLTSLGLAALLATALSIAGAMFTTAVLVMPALIARRLCHRLSLVAPLAVGFAVLATTAGFAIAWSADLPPGQVTVGLLGALLALSWCWPPSWRN